MSETTEVELTTVAPSVDPSVSLSQAEPVRTEPSTNIAPSVDPSVSLSQADPVRVEPVRTEPSINIAPPVAPSVTVTRKRSANITAPTTSPVITTEGSGDATKKIIAIVVIGGLAIVTGVLYNQFPSYAATIMSGFMNAAMIFGGVMIVITAISIMMNVYKPDGFAITLFAGWLGLIGAWVIVPIYTVYHTFWPIKKRPYFGLFPAGFSLPDFGFIDMLLEPFHDGRNLKSYDAMLKTAHQVLYGSSV